MDFYTSKVKSKVEHLLPDAFQHILSLDGSYLMGGAIDSIIHDTYINDFDIFYHKNNREIVKDLFEFNCKKNNYSNKTTHVVKYNHNGINVDLIEYNDNFDPENDVDFTCRMVRFDGINLIGNIQDVIDRKLEYNYNHETSHDVILARSEQIISSSKEFRKLLNNTYKLFAKGYTWKI